MFELETKCFSHLIRLGIEKEIIHSILASWENTIEVSGITSSSCVYSDLPETKQLKVQLFSVHLSQNLDFCFIFSFLYPVRFYFFP